MDELPPYTLSSHIVLLLLSLLLLLLLFIYLFIFMFIFFFDIYIIVLDDKRIRLILGANLS